MSVAPDKVRDCGYKIEVITRRYAVLRKCELYDLLYSCFATYLAKRVRRTKGQAVAGCALRSVPIVKTTRISDSFQNIEE